MKICLMILGLLFGVTACGNASSSDGAAAGAPAGGGAGGQQSAGGAGMPTAGAPSAGAGGEGTVSFADVQGIFNDHCVSCHDKDRVGLPSYPRLSLVEGDSRAALMNKPALETCGGKYVVPGQPSQSYLLHKVADDTPCDGHRMPPGLEVLPEVPLTPDQIALISAWISAGAQ